MTNSFKLFKMLDKNMQSGWKYMILMLCSAAVILLLVRFIKTQTVNYYTKKEIQKITLSKDSLFVLADKIVDSVEKDKRMKECQIDSLRDKLTNQKEVVKIKEVFVEYNNKLSENIVFSANRSNQQEEILKKQEIIEILTEVNQKLSRKIDSLQSIIDKK